MKKIVLIAILCTAVFGTVSYFLSGFQEEYKKDLIAFLRYDCHVKERMVDDRGRFTQDAISAVRHEFGDRRDMEKKALWNRFRYMDYWFSVSKTLVAVGLFVVFFAIIRSALSKIYIPKRIYAKFRQIDLHPENENGDDLSEVPDKKNQY